MHPHLEDDFLACAIVALARARFPEPDDCRRVIDAAFAVLATPTKTRADDERLLRTLKTVMGFGPLGRTKARV